jgi:CHAT domain-containing protein
MPLWPLADEFAELQLSLLPGVNALKLLRERPWDAEGRRYVWGDVTESLAFAGLDLVRARGFAPLAREPHDALASLRDAGIVHFSGHGEFNERDPYRSGVVTGKRLPSDPGPLSGRSGYEERLLTVAEVVAGLAPPRCRLVTLAGCSTGLPRQHPASEHTGLPTAFLIAGARNVVASMWPVDDGAASVLMQLFYENLSIGSQGLRPAAALATARHALRGLTRSDVVARLGTRAGVPVRALPYDSPRHHMAFVHFGVD